MRFRLFTAAIFVAASSILTGCVSVPHAGNISNETVGTVGGVTAGAIIGATIAKNDVAGAVIGAAVGGLVGNRIGANLDEESRRRYWKAQHRALETGRDVEWYNHDRGYMGTVNPGKTRHYGHRLCREYDSTVWEYDTNRRSYQNRMQVSGEGKRVRATACRNPNGTWSPV